MTADGRASSGVPGDLVADYAARGAAHHRAADAATRVDRRIGAARLAVFSAAVLTALAIVESRLDVAPGITVVAILAAAFYALVAWQATVRERARMFRALVRCCEMGVSRALRRWEAL